jgi:hypothetical protein
VNEDLKPQEIGELRPLVPRARSRNTVLQGEDYWIDLESVKRDDEKTKTKKAPTLTEEQFKKDKLREEIVSPYTKNWILSIVLGIGLIVAYVQLNPGVLDTYPVISYPDEL